MAKRLQAFDRAGDLFLRKEVNASSERSSALNSTSLKEHGSKRYCNVARTRHSWFNSLASLLSPEHETHLYLWFCLGTKGHSPRACVSLGGRNGAARP